MTTLVGRRCRRTPRQQITSTPQRRPWQEVFADYAPVILFAAARAFVRTGRPARISQNVAR